jgi:glutamate--cysteine ligase
MAGGAIDRVFERRLAALVNARAPEALRGGLRGLEKETLRVTPAGRIARTPHPQAIGSALCHPHITTDYSEALLELVTSAVPDNDTLLRELRALQTFVYGHLDDELLWCASMPCELSGDADVPIAHYGRSHEGHFKEVYRRGLLNRYGGMMQAIAGVHFNYSLPAGFWPLWAEVRESRVADSAFVSARYLELLRNFRRHGWLVSWLFGASPALCRSFAADAVGLRPHAARTLYGPDSTSLRMSDLGYRNRNQAAVQVSVNSLDDYLRDLLRAVHTPHPPYERIGVKVDGEYRQLSANILQIENEYYSAIRPKRAPRVGELTAQALRRGGVEYVEVRVLDLDMLAPDSMSAEQLDFMEALLVLLLLKDSPPLSNDEQEALDANQLHVARDGRVAGLQLQRDGRAVPLRDWAAGLLDELTGVCELLDAGGTRRYASALQSQRDKLAQPQLLPAAQLQRQMLEHEEEFAAQALRLSRQHRQALLATPLEPALREQMTEQARESVEMQQRMDHAVRGDFGEYLRQRLAAPGAP